jgi:hypothetical protein
MPVRTIARPKVKTIDEAIVLMTEKMAESSAHFEKKIAESSAHFEKKMAESRADLEKKIAESDAKIAESRAYFEKKMAENDAKIQKSMEETREEIKSLSREVKLVNSGLGTIGERFGKLVEFIVIPGIRPEMEKHGHSFRYATANKKFKYMAAGKIEKTMEIDMFLHNGEKAMAVEVKTTLSTGDVDGHLEKLKRLRKYETIANLQGKKLYGAMVGLSIDDNAREHALKNGIYLLKILEQEEKLETESPAKARVW